MAVEKKWISANIVAGKKENSGLIMPGQVYAFANTFEVAAADDDHCVAGAGHLRSLCLTCKRSTTYCIKQFCVCTLFFYDFLTFQQFLLRLGRLDDDSQRFCTVNGAISDARCEFRSVIDHDWGFAPAADGAHFRVVAVLEPLSRFNDDGFLAEFHSTAQSLASMSPCDGCPGMN